MIKDKWKIFAVNEASSDNSDMGDNQKIALFDDLADRRGPPASEHLFNFYNFVFWEGLSSLTYDDIAFMILRTARKAQETEDLS